MGAEAGLTAFGAGCHVAGLGSVRGAVVAATAAGLPYLPPPLSLPSMPALRPQRAALAALVASCLLPAVALGQDPGGHAAPPPGTDPAPEEAQLEQVLVVGDSLAVGMRPHLGGLLGPERSLTWSVRSGITTPQGMQRLRFHLRRVEPAIVVISLGTNDGPDPLRFRSRLRRTLAQLPTGTCVVWPDIIRPPRKGPYVGLNQVLRQEELVDPRLHVVRWRQAVRTGRVALPDGLHPDDAGFRTRSRQVSAAVQRHCA